MPKTKQEIIDDMLIPQWSVEVMQVAVAAKKQSRREKGKDFNCCVVDERKINADRKDELVVFLEELKGQMQIRPMEGYRVQLIVKNRDGPHFTAIDLQVVNGKVLALCVDAANDVIGMDSLSSVGKVFPDSLRYTYNADVYTEDDKEKRSLIQFDKVSCSRFAQDILSRLSKIDNLPEILDNQRQPHPFRRNVFGEHLIQTSQVPHELSGIFNATQSGSTLRRLSIANQTEITSSKGLTVLEYAEAHAEHDTAKNKTVYRAIDHKKDERIAEVDAFLTQFADDDLETIHFQASGISEIQQYPRPPIPIEDTIPIKVLID